MKFQYSKDVLDHLQWALVKLQATENVLIKRENKLNDQPDLRERVGEARARVQDAFEYFDYWFGDFEEDQPKLPF